MKIFVLLLATFVAFTSALDEEDLIFQAYQERFGPIRSAKNSNLSNAKKNVVKRLREVQEHNERFENGNETFRADLNPLSWKEEEDLKNESLGYVEPSSKSGIKSVPPPFSSRVRRETLPNYFNWADKGVVRPVQNQGSCLSCYAFAAVGAIESRACITKGQCGTMSKQEAMECTNSCNGGWDHDVYRYAQNEGGCTSSSYYYLGYPKNSCATAKTRPRQRDTKPTSWYNLEGISASEREYRIRYHLKQLGPMFVVFEVYNNFYQYSSGVYSSKSGNFLGTHAVLLTGWGTENGNPYWILRNSWGTQWGEKGYFRMKRGIDLCRIESIRVTLPLV